MDVKYKLATLILSARLDAKLTQSETAEAIGVSTRWFQRLEAGEKLPGSLTLLRLLLFFEIDPEKLREEVELFDFVSSNTRKILNTRK